MVQSDFSSRRFLLVIGQQLLGTVLSILTAMALARMLSTAAFGEFNAAYGVMMIASVGATLGLNQFIVVPFRKAMATGLYDHARGLRRWVPCCIVAAGLLSYGVLLTTHILLGGHAAVKVASFAAVLAMLPLAALMSFLVATANTHEAAGRAMFLATPGLQLLVLISLGLVAFLAGKTIGVLEAAAIWASATLIICVSLWRLNRLVEDPEFKRGARKTDWRGWAEGTFPYFVSGVVNMFLIQAPFIVLGWVHADAENAAMFAAADRLGQILAVAGTASMAIFAPAIADVIASGSRQRYVDLMRRWFLIVGSSTAACFALIAISGEALLGWYGAQYEGAYGLLLVISGSVGLSMLGLFFLIVLQFKGRARSVVVTSLIWTFLGFLGMVGLAESWAQMGAAIAQAAAFIGMYLTFTIQAVRVMRGRLHE